MVVVDRGGRIRLVNHLTEDLFGYFADKLVGQPVELLVPERLRAIHQQRRTAHAANPYVHPFGAGIPLSGQRQDGSEFPLQASLAPLQDRDESLIIICFHDMSDLQDAHDAQIATQAAYQDLDALQALTDTALSHLALEDLLPALLQRVTEVLGVDNVGVLLLDSAEQTLNVQTAYQFNEPVSTQLQVAVGEGIVGRIAATGEPLVVDNLATFPIAVPVFRGHFHSAAGVPLKVGDQLLGVVLVGTERERHFTPRDVQLLQQVADRMALAIDRAQLYMREQEAREQAEAAKTKAEVALARAQVSEHRYRRLVEANIFGIAVTDTECVLEANEVFLQLVGYTQDDVHAGRLCRETLSPPETHVLSEDSAKEAVAKGASPPFEREYLRKDGSRVPVLVAPVLLQRDPVRLLNFVLDLSERKQLEREREAAHTEAELQAAQLAAIFEAIADGLVVVDAEGHLVRENAAQQRLEGRDTVRDAAAPDFAQLSLPERLVLFAARDAHGRPLGLDEGPLPRALRGEIVSGAETMDIRSRTLGGREIELSVSAAPLWDREGHLTGAVGIFRDQTVQNQLERKRAEQAEQLDRLFEGNADGLVLYDTQGQLVRLNAEARRILALDAAPAEYAQLSIPDRLQLYEAYDKQGHRLEVEELPAVRVLRGQVKDAVALEIRLRTLDGRELELYVRAEPLRDEVGRLTGAVTVMHDQTAENRLAREREEAHARELAAERVAQQMSAFLATAAHDIRSPLTVAAARVQMALKVAERLAVDLDTPLSILSVTAEPPKLLADEVRESLQRAYAGMDRLKRLVNLLFDVTQAQSQQLVLELAAVDLRALVEEQVAAEQHATAGGHRLHLQLPTHAVRVEADTDRLDEVLANFISNALKYSPSAQPVEVRLSVEEQEAVVRVTDQGPGISPEEQCRIWDSFYRSPDVSLQPGNQSTKGSLGLGLSICKQLIELHPGGRLGVESAVGKGSTFWFRLPLSS
jgi:PAS domain S-box-containing protein